MEFDRLKRFYSGKRVLVTGHTGFKGTWLCKLLVMLGADVYGYALAPMDELNIYDLTGIQKDIHSKIADIRDFDTLKDFIGKIRPDYVFHLAAQPIVRESYRIPRETYEINVMGTVNLMECMRFSYGTKGLLNVTTDKVYENLDNANHFFSEDEKLDGYDPYSNSKSCSELVTHAYKKSFFYDENSMRVSTARAGNVIGGGDYSKDRIIPDCIRAAVEGRDILIRNPNSTRPYQHVLDPLVAYLTIVMSQEKDGKLEGYYNVGPEEKDCVSTGTLADLFVNRWGEGLHWIDRSGANNVHEASYLKLDSSKIRELLGWKPMLHIEEAVDITVDWYKAWASGMKMDIVTGKQIEDFFKITKR